MFEGKKKVKVVVAMAAGMAGDTLEVSVNGEKYSFKCGAASEVPVRFAEALKNSRFADMAAIIE
ncbi:MAG: hypothetical protein ACOYJD_08320 [Christensenellales bacterium]|jgi:hypothetical protein